VNGQFGLADFSQRYLANKRLLQQLGLSGRFSLLTAPFPTLQPHAPHFTWLFSDTHSPLRSTHLTFQPTVLYLLLHSHAPDMMGILSVVPNGSYKFGTWPIAD